MTDLSQDQIDSGCAKLMDWKSDFPPTVLQFRQLCLPATISPDGRSSNAYLNFADPRHPNNSDPDTVEAIGNLYSKNRLEDKSVVTKNQAANKKAMKDLKL